MRNPQGAAVPLLQMDGLGVAYGHGRRKSQIIDNISLSIRPGETLGLVGESGSGKSTLGRALLGLVPISHGRLDFDGTDITNVDRRARRLLATKIQVIFQDPYTSLNPAMVIRDTLMEPLRAQGVSRSEARTRVSALLERVDLPIDALDRYPREFSGGQRQRIAIARALSLNPKLIVCDEPVSALDLSTQLTVLDLLIELQEGMGVSYLFISHDLSVVRHISHRVCVMHRGEIVESGPTLEVTDRPQHPYTRRLWASNLVADPDDQRERRARRRASPRLEDSEI